VLCSLLWVTLLGQGVGLGDPQRSLPTPTILWFCDSVINTKQTMNFDFNITLLKRSICHLMTAESTNRLQSGWGLFYSKGHYRCVWQVHLCFTASLSERATAPINTSRRGRVPSSPRPNGRTQERRALTTRLSSTLPNGPLAKHKLLHRDGRRQFTVPSSSAEFGSPASAAASRWRPPHHHRLLNSLPGEEREGGLGFMNHLLLLLCQKINSVFLCGHDIAWTSVPY